MAKLELNDDDAETLIDTLDLDIDRWQDELEEICMQPFDSWEELLEHSSFSAEMITKLTRLRNQLHEQHN